MWRSVVSLVGYRTEATDGPLGKVRDFYFDDHSWTIRYLVLDTGVWLPGRQVLVSPETFESPDWERRRFPLHLTKRQIENSPAVDIDKPVSRQQEERLTSYFGWTPYWTTLPTAGAGVDATVRNPAIPELERRRLETGDREQDPHLRSVGEVAGHRLHALDGYLGKIEDFIVNDADWTIRFIVADTRAWLPGKSVLLAPSWIKAVRWQEKTVEVELTQDQVRRSPVYDPSEPVNEDIERHLYDFYGRPLPAHLREPASTRR